MPATRHGYRKVIEASSFSQRTVTGGRAEMPGRGKEASEGGNQIG